MTNKINVSFEVEGIDTPSEVQAQARDLIVEALHTLGLSLEGSEDPSTVSDLRLIEAILGTATPKKKSDMGG